MEKDQPPRTPPPGIYGRLGSAEGYTIREFLGRSGRRFEGIELTSDEEARARAGVSNPGCVANRYLSGG